MGLGPHPCPSLGRDTPGRCLEVKGGEGRLHLVGPHQTHKWRRVVLWLQKHGNAQCQRCRSQGDGETAGSGLAVALVHPKQGLGAAYARAMRLSWAKRGRERFIRTARPSPCIWGGGGTSGGHWPMWERHPRLQTRGP